MITIIILVLIVIGISSTTELRKNESNTFGAFFSVSSITDKLLLLVKRFPISILLIIGLAILFFIGINRDFDDISYQLWIFFSVSAILSVVTTLFIEDYFSNLKNYGITLFAVLLWGIYCFFLPEKFDDIQINKGIEIFVIGGVAFFAIFFISFFKNNNDNAFWNFTTHTLFQMVLASIFGSILFGGLSLALLAVDSLFNISVDSKTYWNLAVICFALFTPIYFLANIKNKTEKHSDKIFYNKVHKILALYIITPILAVYAVILYAYLFKIIFAWELPNGWVSWLVSALALGGLLVITILYPVRKLEENKIVNFISHWFGLLILPLLLLMTIGIFRRIGDYGITINRGYILILNLWFYGIYIYLFITKSRHVKWILISFVAIGLITSLNAVGVANVAKKSLSKEVCTILVKQKSVEEARKTFAEMTHEEKARMKSTLEYLHKNFGKKSVQPFFIDAVSDNYWNFLSELGLQDVFEEASKHISFYTENDKTWQIAGYNNFTQIEYYGYRDNDLSDKEHIVLEISSENLTFYIPIREVAMECLATDEKLRKDKDWVVEGDDYKLLIKSLYGDYYPEKDSIYINNISGFLFYK